MNFKNGVKKIQAAAYNGARTVFTNQVVDCIISGQTIRQSGYCVAVIDRFFALEKSGHLQSANSEQNFEIRIWKLSGNQGVF